MLENRSAVLRYFLDFADIEFGFGARLIRDYCIGIYQSIEYWEREEFRNDKLTRKWMFDTRISEAFPSQEHFEAFCIAIHMKPVRPPQNEKLISGYVFDF